MKAVKTIAALIFVTLLGIVLVQPVLGASDEPVREAGAPSGDETPGPGEAEAAPEIALMARYPNRCLRPVTPSPEHLVAARRGSRVLIGPPGGRPAATAEVEGDAAWSPSGTFLAERGGRVVDQSGTPRGTLFYRPVEWSWSPVADCALAITESGNLTYSIPATRRLGIRLLAAPVSAFELSPNGRRLALEIEGGGLWVADLARGEVLAVKRRNAFLAGWFSNARVLYSKHESEGTLRFATGSGETGQVRNGRAGGALTRCGDRVLLVGGAGDAAPPLSEIVSPGRGMKREILAESPRTNNGLWGASCSPDGRSIAASALRRDGAKGPLVLLDAGGAYLRQLAPGRTANPTWSDDGLTFVKFGAAGRGRLWFVAPGAAPVPTEYRVGGPAQYDWHVGD